MKASTPCHRKIKFGIQLRQYRLNKKILNFISQSAIGVGLLYPLEGEAGTEAVVAVEQLGDA